MLVSRKHMKRCCPEQLPERLVVADRRAARMAASEEDWISEEEVREAALRSFALVEDPLLRKALELRFGADRGTGRDHFDSFPFIYVHFVSFHMEFHVLLYSYFVALVSCSFDVETVRWAAAQPSGGCGGFGRQVPRQSGGKRRTFDHLLDAEMPLGSSSSAAFRAMDAIIERTSRGGA